MKKYQIIKYNNFYSIANKNDIKEYHKTHFLPYEKGMKYKKYLIEAIENSKTFVKYKNNTDYKTFLIN